MLNVGNMNFFKVNLCGLYRMNDKTPHGIELKETFELISTWAKNRPMSTTLPWNANSLSSRSKCYLRDICTDPETGDFLVVLWKSDAQESGGIWGAEEDAEIGSGDVVQYTDQHRGKKVIWGRPCYYWVIPTLQSVVSIKFDHSICDSQLFQDFVSGCINNRVDHPGRVKDTTERGYVRISHSDGDDKYRYGYRFEVSLRSLDTTNVELGKFAQTVTHIIRRETIQVVAKDERAEWIKRFNKTLPYVSAKPKSKQRQIEIRAEAKPTVAEIKEIIELYAKESRKSGGWDNVGFYGESGITWVDKYRLKAEVVLSESPKGVLPASFLLRELKKKRESFMSPVMKSLTEVSPATTARPRRREAT
jgi:hypothetical protein